jgi:large subunit ribosomal protein L21
MEKKSTFAVIETGGKQYLVTEGDMVSIEKLPGEFNEGDALSFDSVLLIGKDGKTTLGMPYISGAKVEAELIEQGKGKKIKVLRFRAKSRYTRRYGHRQPFMKIKVTAIK